MQTYELTRPEYRRRKETEFSEQVVTRRRERKSECASQRSTNHTREFVEKAMGGTPQSDAVEHRRVKRGLAQPRNDAGAWRSPAQRLEQASDVVRTEVRTLKDPRRLLAPT